MEMRRREGIVPIAGKSRGLLSLILGLLVGWLLLTRRPFPEENNLLQLVLLEKPYLFYGIKWTYAAICVTTPYIGASLLSSLIYIFTSRQDPRIVEGKLSPYLEP